MKNYLTNLVLVGFLSIFPSNILADPVLIDDLYYELNKMYVPDEYLEEYKNTIPWNDMESILPLSQKQVEKETINISVVGYATYTSKFDLDFRELRVKHHNY